MDVSKFKYDHLPLDKDVTKVLEPIYTDLSSRELLGTLLQSTLQSQYLTMIFMLF